MCSWIISLTGAVECFINDRTQRSDHLVPRFELMAEARPSSSKLTPEEISDLVLRFRGPARVMEDDACTSPSGSNRLKGDE